MDEKKRITLVVLNDYLKFDRTIYQIFGIPLGRPIKLKSIAYFFLIALIEAILYFLPIVGYLLHLLPFVFLVAIPVSVSYLLTDVRTEGRSSFAFFRSIFFYQIRKRENVTYVRAREIAKPANYKFTGYATVNYGEYDNIELTEPVLNRVDVTEPLLTDLDVTNTEVPEPGMEIIKDVKRRNWFKHKEVEVRSTKVGKPKKQKPRKEKKKIEKKMTEKKSIFTRRTKKDFMVTVKEKEPINVKEHVNKTHSKNNSPISQTKIESIQEYSVESPVNEVNVSPTKGTEKPIRLKLRKPVAVIEAPTKEAPLEALSAPAVASIIKEEVLVKPPIMLVPKDTSPLTDKEQLQASLANKPTIADLKQQLREEKEMQKKLKKLNKAMKGSGY